MSRSGFRTRDDVAYAESRIANERAAAAIMAASWPPSLSLSADFYCLPQRVHFNFSAGRIYSTAG